ncbi:hypothetical protein ANCDUO_19511 [Ancylostoma duodenale]|uniref:Uncharacterized protein n=1 Tax=Ancylostoma duodenale TaxID=51022 RepID=A0A0C2FPG0_9BILA|nr:hypothetical protein ANCDUO_19511 [Ancylostoma duodenale]
MPISEIGADWAEQATPTSVNQLEVETAGRACLKACEAAKNCVLPQLRHEGVEFTRHASQFIGCVAAYVVEMKRCVALEKTFPAPTEPSITPQQVGFHPALPETQNLLCLSAL